MVDEGNIRDAASNSESLPHGHEKYMSQSRKKKYIWIGITILIVVLILAAIGIALGLTLPKKSTTTTETPKPTSTPTASASISSTSGTTITQILPPTKTIVCLPPPCQISANKIYVSIFLDITIFAQDKEWQPSLTSAIAMKMGLHEGGCTRMSVNGVADAMTPNATFRGSLDAINKDIQYIREIAPNYQPLLQFNVADALNDYSKNLGQQVPEDAILVILIYAMKPFTDIPKAVTAADSLRSKNFHTLIVAGSKETRDEIAKVADSEGGAIAYGGNDQQAVEWFDEMACIYVHTARPNVGLCRQKAYK
ncbi:hypothetical protein Tcan_11643 [Toxocara canis]|uniref:VWFA domain-containing protein n=1 Tax=Toxocara canis TaxID=6265 RepID=A0A0B2VPA7_TOXCA|nr:hypothetical protein Tcan_11643 [Toxocara canis]